MFVNFNVINQKGSPAIYEDSLSIRPAAGYPGRLFVDTNIVSTGLYRDTGSEWQLIASIGSGSPLNWDEVLALGGQFQTSRLADANNNNFQIDNLNSIEFDVYNNGDHAPAFTINADFSFNIGDIKHKTQYSPSINSSTKDGNIYTLLGEGTDTFKRGINIGNIPKDSVDLWRYQFGDYGNNTTGTYLEVNESTSNISAYFQGNTKGLQLDFNGGTYVLGDNTKSEIVIDNDVEIYTRSQSHRQTGFILNFQNNNYTFGNYSGTDNLYSLTYNDIYNDSHGNPSAFSEIYTQGYNGNNIDYYININTDTSSVHYAYNGFDQGIYLDYTNNNYQFGDFNINVNGSSLNINDDQQIIYTSFGNSGQGLKLDKYNGQYSIGDYLNNNNDTYLTIDDANGVLILNGNNLQSGTAGSSTGQYLIIKLNGTLYKIDLLNL